MCLQENESNFKAEYAKFGMKVPDGGAGENAFETALLMYETANDIRM